MILKNRISWQITENIVDVVVVFCMAESLRAAAAAAFDALSDLFAVWW